MGRKFFSALLLLLGLTLPGFSWSLFSQGPVVLTLNAVVLLGLIGFLIFVKLREKGDD